MEKQDHSAIATHRSANPRVETAMRPNSLRFEDDRGLPGFELEGHARPDPLIADRTTQTGDMTVLGRSIVS
jgi:hypothetical protein